MEGNHEHRTCIVSSKKRKFGGAAFILVIISAIIPGCSSKTAPLPEKTPLPENRIIKEERAPEADTKMHEQAENEREENRESMKEEELFIAVHEDKAFQWLIRPSDNTNTYDSPFTRYSFVRRDRETEEELILDDLLWDEVTLDKPVIFTGERFIYTAAQKDSIISFKEPGLVSIKPDGRNRKFYKPLYGSVKALCYDNGLLYYEGWTNDSGFPRPICSLTPELTKDLKIQDINGILLTVYDGVIYYLSNDKKKTGIYGVKPGDDKEPVLIDKAGNKADEFILIEAAVKKGTLYAKLKSIHDDSFIWDYQLDLNKAVPYLGL